LPQRQAIALGCALLLGAAIAFPAGLLLGGSGVERERSVPARSGGPFREVYSPSIYQDPYFLEQQRRNVAALQEACSVDGELCAEARQARERLREIEQGD